LEIWVTALNVKATVRQSGSMQKAKSSESGSPATMEKNKMYGQGDDLRYANSENARLRAENENLRRQLREKEKTIESLNRFVASLEREITKAR
jgi:predicted RNase H-like nuclease (RuvC/YqgF family)